MEVYIDFRGYRPFCTFDVYSADGTLLESDATGSDEHLRELIKKRGYKVIPNPHFKGVFAHEKFVEYLNK